MNLMRDDLTPLPPPRGTAWLLEHDEVVQRVEQMLRS
jgi:hypothetical protein